MAKRSKETVVEGTEAGLENIPATTISKVRKLIIRNFCCIGNTPVEIELDQIVVLVGPNNAGKSTILRAYEKITGSSQPELALSEFHLERVNPDSLPEIELHTAIIDVENLPGQSWIDRTSGENIVRERWIWQQPGKGGGKRQGFDVASNTWVEKVPWGAANVANANRPLAHRIEAFASPEEQAEQVKALLLKSIKEQIKALPLTEKDGDSEKPSPYGELLGKIGSLQKRVVSEAQAEIESVENALTEFVSEIFHGYKVKFDAKPEENLASALNFFKAEAELQMGHADGHFSPIQRQGSGARRTLMWAALKYLAETGKKSPTGRQNLLLLDEPELCLHPNAIREACKTLYSLADSGSWQIMITTHSPVFIDLSRDNTTVVRVERDNSNNVKGITVFRPDRVRLSEIDKVELKLSNLFDPYLAEFFFGGRIILVEGDTEYTVFRYLIAQANNAILNDIHIVRARGKITISLLAKILNQFDASYSILHDADNPVTIRNGKEIVNPAWTNNLRIYGEFKNAKPGRARLVANVPDFEGAIFGSSVTKEKPSTAYQKLQCDEEAVKNAHELLQALIDFSRPVPEKCVEWNSLEELQKRVE